MQHKIIQLAIAANVSVQYILKLVATTRGHIPPHAQQPIGQMTQKLGTSAILSAAPYKNHIL